MARGAAGLKEHGRGFEGLVLPLRWKHPELSVPRSAGKTSPEPDAGTFILRESEPPRQPRWLLSAFPAPPCPCHAILHSRLRPPQKLIRSQEGAAGLPGRRGDVSVQCISLEGLAAPV